MQFSLWYGARKLAQKHTLRRVKHVKLLRYVRRYGFCLLVYFSTVLFSVSGMEFFRWKELIKEILPSHCCKFATDIRSCVKAVDAKVKPSYMFDLAFVPADRIIVWLRRLQDVHLVRCRLSVIAIEQHIFIVNRSTIKCKMNEIACGNEEVMIVDVSSDLKQPQSTSMRLCHVVQYTAQVIAVTDLSPVHTARKRRYPE